MRCLLVLALSSSVLALSSRWGGSHQCQQATVSVNITARPQVIHLAPPRNQSELTGIITSFTSGTSNVSSEIIHGRTNLTATYDIWTLLCLPSNIDQPSTVEFTIHGINFDHSYWKFGGEGSQYNYADAALNAGHAIFLYDRLGVGKSSKPDGIKEVQEATEVEIAAQLINYLKSGKSGHQFKHFIGIGHSFGSAQLNGVAAKYGNLLDATILTGFSPFTGGINAAIASFGLTIACQQNHSRFGSLSNSYLATGTISNDQAPFFYFPFFDPNILQLASATKATATIGEWFTLSARIASNYSNPVLVVTGDKDFIFCGGNCYQTFADSPNLIESSKVLFPRVQHFDFFIPANTGHGLNLHYGAQDVYTVIQTWISQLPEWTDKE